MINTLLYSNIAMEKPTILMVFTREDGDLTIGFPDHKGPRRS